MDCSGSKGALFRALIRSQLVLKGLHVKQAQLKYRRRRGHEAQHLLKCLERARGSGFELSCWMASVCFGLTTALIWAELRTVPRNDIHWLGDCALFAQNWPWVLGTQMALFHCMVRHGTVQYGSLLGGFPLGTVPGTWSFFSTTSAGVPSDPYRYQNVTCKLYWSLIGRRKSSLLRHWTGTRDPTYTR